MKKAIIDLGTNTFNLLIGEIRENELHIEHTEKEAVMLGMGGINQGLIANDALDRAFATLSRFKDECERRGVKRILGLGTSAMRVSKNADRLIQAAKENLNIDIQVISGEQEAQLIFKGVGLTHDFSETAIIMDIGGGSDEFIHAGAEGIRSATSFEIGVSRIYQLLDKPEIFTEDLKQKMGRIFDAETKGYFDNLEVAALIGASGSFETLFEMVHQQKYTIQKDSIELPFEEVRHVLHWSLDASLEDRMSHPWIVPMRKKMLPIAAFSILWVMEKLETQRLLVSPYSLKEGAFLMK